MSAADGVVDRREFSRAERRGMLNTTCIFSTREMEEAEAMAREPAPPSQAEIEERIQQVGRYSRLVRAGLIVILSAFLLAVGGVLPANLENPSQAIESILMPLTFVGLGLILYGIGMHLHLMHLNLVRQLQPEPGKAPSSNTKQEE